MGALRSRNRFHLSSRNFDRSGATARREVPGLQHPRGRRDGCDYSAMTTRGQLNRSWVSSSTWGATPWTQLLWTSCRRRHARRDRGLDAILGGGGWETEAFISTRHNRSQPKGRNTIHMPSGAANGLDAGCSRRRVRRPWKNAYWV